MPNPVLDPLAARLQADLRLRFPEITVRFARDEDSWWMCRVEDGVLHWGNAPTNFDDDEPSHCDTERILAEVTIEVADNLWPDELTDPWPLCPRHGDHPLQAQFVAGQAVWLCLRDTSVMVPVGALDSSSSPPAAR